MCSIVSSQSSHHPNCSFQTPFPLWLIPLCFYLSSLQPCCLTVCSATLWNHHQPPRWKLQDLRHQYQCVCVCACYFLVCICCSKRNESESWVPEEQRQRPQVCQDQTDTHTLSPTVPNRSPLTVLQSLSQWNKPVNADGVVPLWISDWACWRATERNSWEWTKGDTFQSIERSSTGQPSIVSNEASGKVRFPSLQPSHAVILFQWGYSQTCVYVRLSAQVQLTTSTCSCACGAWLCSLWETSFKIRQDLYQSKHSTGLDWVWKLGKGS